MRIYRISFFLTNTVSNYNLNNLSTNFEISINILITLSLIWLFLFVNLDLIEENLNNPFLYLQKEENTKKNNIINQKYSFDYKDENNVNKSVRELTTFFQGKYNKDQLTADLNNFIGLNAYYENPIFT